MVKGMKFVKLAMIHEDIKNDWLFADLEEFYSWYKHISAIPKEKVFWVGKWEIEFDIPYHVALYRLNTGRLVAIFGDHGKILFYQAFEEEVRASLEALLHELELFRTKDNALASR